MESFKLLYHDESLLAALTGILVLAGLLGYAVLTRQRYLRSRRSLNQEIEFRRNEQRFRELFDQMPEPVWVVRDSHFIEANPAAMRAIGYAHRPDFLNLHPGDISPEFQPDGRPSREKAEEMARIGQEQGVHRFEWVHRRIDGSIFPVEVTLTTMEWEGQPAICCIWRDISERQALLQRVQASEARFRALFESANDAILLGRGAELLDCNPRALQLFGLESREQLVGLHPVDLSPTVLPDGRDARLAADEYVQEALEKGHCLFEWVSRKMDGSLFPSEVLLSSFRLGNDVFLQSRVRDLTEEKRAIQNLLDSEARFRALFESSSDAIMLLKDGCFEDCNEKTLQLFGIPNKESIIGRRPDALSPERQPDGQASASLAQSWYRQALTGGVARFEWRHRRADGREFPADILLSRFRMGEALWIQATVRDITELKAAEAALQASEANLRRAQAVANVGSWTLEMPGDRLIWSEQTYRIFGVEPGTPMTFADFVRIIHPADRGRVDEAWQAALQGATYSIEHRILVNGEERWVQEQSELEVGADGVVVAGIGTVQDITPRKRAELALQALNEELEERVAKRTAELENLTQQLRDNETAVLAQSQRLMDVIWGADIGTWELHIPSGKVVLNERWAELLGYSLAELEPTRIDTWRQLTEPADLRRAEAILKRCFARELDHYECEIRMRHKGGDWIWVLDRGRVVEWSGEGQPLRMTGTHLDITKRKRAEQAIRDINISLEQKVAERTAQLEVASRAKSEFLANMSHEIRTPMNAILGLTQLLEREPLSADQQDLLRKINDSGQCLLHVINDVLDFSKIEAGQLKLENQAFDLAPVLFRLESLLGHVAREKGLILDVNPPAGLPGRLRGDAL
ncbi:MAG: putative sensory/regulatory protein RpfC, partial [Pseudomonadota bacterium]